MTDAMLEDAGRANVRRPCLELLPLNRPLHRCAGRDGRVWTGKLVDQGQMFDVDHGWELGSERDQCHWPADSYDGKTMGLRCQSLGIREPGKAADGPLEDWCIADEHLVGSKRQRAVGIVTEGDKGAIPPMR